MRRILLHRRKQASALEHPRTWLKLEAPGGTLFRIDKSCQNCTGAFFSRSLRCRLMPPLLRTDQSLPG